MDARHYNSNKAYFVFSTDAMWKFKKMENTGVKYKYKLISGHVTQDKIIHYSLYSTVIDAGFTVRLILTQTDFPFKIIDQTFCLHLEKYVDLVAWPRIHICMENVAQE